MRRTVVIATLAAVTAMAWGVDTLVAQDTATNETVKKLVVGVKEAPPFVMKTEDGKWTGITVDLSRTVAEEATLAYEFEEVSLDEMLSGLSDGSIDVGVGALTVTAERESAFDFSHPFYSSGLGIAVQRRGDSQWMQVLQRVFSVEFLTVIAALALLLLGVGAAVWIFERKRNPEQFGAGRGKGLGAGFWWAAVTMTTVGYGDKAPMTGGGRLVALVWMFASIIIISVFTAGITTALTVSSLESGISGPDDLPGVRVASVADTTSSEWLYDEGIAYSTFDDIASAMDSLAVGTSDAVVYDEPILRWLVQQVGDGELRVLPGTFERQDYGIGLQQDSAFREKVNQAVLQHITSNAWDKTLHRYLGR